MPAPAPRAATPPAATKLLRRKLRRSRLMSSSKARRCLAKSGQLGSLPWHIDGLPVVREGGTYWPSIGLAPPPSATGSEHARSLTAGAPPEEFLFCRQCLTSESGRPR